MRDLHFMCEGTGTDRWQPRISVIIPVYNGAPYLCAAIDSVLMQTYPPSELIVVDDGSTDDGAALVAALPAPVATRLILVRQTNQGPAAARNHGLQLATGELVAFLDADDLWLPEKLQQQVLQLNQDPALDGVVCHMESFLEPGVDWPQQRNKAYYEQRPPAYSLCALLVRKERLERVGWFDPNLRTAEDSDWFFRARDANLTIAVTPSVLLRRRFHATNLSHSAQASPQQMLDIIRASLKRRQYE